MRDSMTKLLSVTVLISLCGWAYAGRQPARRPAAPPALLKEALAGPMKDVEEIVFCTRARYDDGHWYANIGYYCDNENQKAYPGNGKPDVGKLCKWNVRTGEITVLLDARGGSVRDPQVHYDGKKILFSYRKADSEYFHLYEINTDGSGLKQITSGEIDDFEPAYLPDGGIAFVSTRCNRWVNCWKTQVAVIYRCDADGKRIRLLSANTEHDNTPWVLPDGRILYTRWEYVDRSQVEYHHLWTMNPDGTNATVYYGNMHPKIVMIDAKPIPGTKKAIVSFSPGHGANEHQGMATIVTPRGGPDDLGEARAIHKGKRVTDPIALSENCFLAARAREFVLMDGRGNSEVIYTHKGDGAVHEPRPIMKRERERIIPPRLNRDKPVGYLVLSDVYNGRNLGGVKKGDIKKLLVLESLPKQVNFSGGQDLLSWLGTFTLERVLGTVPVEEDGSAFFEVPPYRQVFFVALDENDMSVKRMQSFTNVVPGEVTSCVGCHEHRNRTPENRTPGTLMALRRPASKIQSFEGFPDVVDFHRDVQPIFDRHCVECHGYERRDGSVLLGGDLGPVWSHSYYSLLANLQVGDGRNGLGNQPPRTLGSSASPLLQKLDKSHYDVKVTPREWRMIWLWTESGATYAGSYAALRNVEEQTRAGVATAQAFAGQRQVLQRRCSECHALGKTNDAKARPLPFRPDSRNKRGVTRPTGIHERIVVENDPLARYSSHILVNFSRPALSPLVLGPLATDAGGWGSCGDVFKNKEDPDYLRMVAAIEKGKAVFDAEPRFATPDFKPNRQYVREMKKYGVLPTSFDWSKNHLDVFEADQMYWKSFWYKPPDVVVRRLVVE